MVLIRVNFQNAGHLKGALWRLAETAGRNKVFADDGDGRYAAEVICSNENRDAVMQIAQRFGSVAEISHF